MTRIKTERATYNIVAVELHGNEIILRAKSLTGKTERKITRKDVTSVRWYGALAHFFRSQAVI